MPERFARHNTEAFLPVLSEFFYVICYQNLTDLSITISCYLSLDKIVEKFLKDMIVSSGFLIP